MMRNDMNIALVSMVRQSVAVNNSSIVSNLNATEVPIPRKDGGEFDWSTSVQSMILSSFYAWYVLSQVKDKYFSFRFKRYSNKVVSNAHEHASFLLVSSR